MLRRKTLAAGALAAGCLLAAQGAAAAPPGDVSAQLHGGTLTVRGGDDADLVGIRARGLAIEVRPATTRPRSGSRSGRCGGSASRPARATTA